MSIALDLAPTAEAEVSEILADRALASGESKASFSLKNTSWRPMMPNPTGRHLSLELPAASVG